MSFKKPGPDATRSERKRMSRLLLRFLLACLLYSLLLQITLPDGTPLRFSTEP
jgi:hypothetical protein